MQHTTIQKRGIGDNLNHNANIVLTTHDPRAMVSRCLFLASLVSVLYRIEEDQNDKQASSAMMSAPIVRWLRVGGRRSWSY